MAPNKTNRSPFGLFMAKMKRCNPHLRSMSMPMIVSHCTPLYEELSEDVRKRLIQLSQEVRTSNLNDRQFTKKLDGLSLKESTASVSETTADGGQQCDDNNSSVASTVATNVPQMGFVFNSGQNRFEDNSYDDSDEDFDPLGKVDGAIKATDQFPKASIVCICFNVLVRTQEDQYLPNEVGLTAFNVEEGFQKSYTKLIANNIPSGYYSTAKEFSEKYHKIPINCKANPIFETNYETLFHEIYDFMSASDLKDYRNRKIVFCKAEQNGCSDLSQVNGCLKWLQTNATKQSVKSLTDDFLVVDISNLLFLTTKIYCQAIRPLALCSDSLTRTTFDFYQGMRCEFHSEDENNYCALAATKRTAYLFLDHLFAIGFKPEFEIKPKPTHRPIKQEINSYTYILPSRETAPIFRPRYRYTLDPQALVPQPPEVGPAIGLGRGQRPRNARN